VFPALEKGEIDLLPEYNGSVLSFLDKNATQTTSEEVDSALAPLLDAKGLVALEPSPAEDKDGWAVTKEPVSWSSAALRSSRPGPPAFPA
jgi:osmoprotectant transport system substrate-binding protein